MSYPAGLPHDKVALASVASYSDSDQSRLHNDPRTDDIRDDDLRSCRRHKAGWLFKIAAL
jgi:hypothetical protein